MTVRIAPPTHRARRSRRHRLLAVALGSLLALGGCAGERPTLGSATVRTGSSSTSTTVPGSTTSTTALVDGVLGVDDLLGYIATPKGTPDVHEAPEAASPSIDIGTETSAGAPTTFAVVGDPTTGEATSRGWLQVVLPTRPNGATGWVPALTVAITKTPFRVFVDLPERTLRVEEDGAEVFETTVAIGTEENPTPTGGSFITELIRNRKSSGSYGPYAFGLALHSNTLSEFNGGPGQVGIHGTNTPATIGQAVSHGCVRLRNADITKMVDLALPLGVPVFIT